MVLFIDLRVQCGADVDNQGYDHTTRAGQNKSNRQHLNSTHRVRHSPSSRLASIRPMDDKYDWEVWDPTSLSFRHHMIAGIFAGVSEHIVFFPIDTVRVRFPTASGDFLDDTPGGLFRRNPSQYQGPARRLPCGGGLSRRAARHSPFISLVEECRAVRKVQRRSAARAFTGMESSLERHVSHTLRVHPRPRIVLFDLRVHKGLSGRKGQQTYPPLSIWASSPQCMRMPPRSPALSHLSPTMRS